MPTRRAAALVAGVALASTGCSAFEDPPEPTRITAPPEGAPTLPTTQSFTVVDSTFSQLMIAHHAQAAEMADLVPERTDTPEVLALAREIKDAQQPEVDRMTAWLTEWGLEAVVDPAESIESIERVDVEGMLTETELQELRDASGPEFDRLWLKAMIAHHEGAVTMAEAVLSAGVHRPTLTLAEGILRAREAEITRMRAMLGS